MKKFGPEYAAWRNMHYRCYNPTNPQYKNYGARGIEVCDSWKNNFAKFAKDMGERPSSEYSLDRIDNNGNYEPSNCKWSTKSEQAHNRRFRSKYPGVVYLKDRKKWLARITKNKRQYTFGRYDTPEEAHSAYMANRGHFF